MSCWPRTVIPVVLSCGPHTAESEVAALGFSRGAVGLVSGHGGGVSELGHGSTVSEVAIEAYADVGLVPVYEEGGAATPPAAIELKAAIVSVAAAALVLATRSLALAASALASALAASALAASALSISAFAASVGRPKASKAWM